MTTKENESVQQKDTEIVLAVGDQSIPAVLNGNRSAAELCARLPVTVSLHRDEHDYCGVMPEPLAYDRADLQDGWTNGDLAFAPDGDYFAILYKDEEISKQFGNLVPLGRLTVPPETMESLPPAIQLTIAMA